eukprot:TRINITY_DN35203_c0_g1_i4.p1 TRINITY_DN35203_c0_g1~~TRINITY_DN35203_c0_g1_i4.p1  ORF type:complete len:147 (-),score=33.39 TRINITY_DN35203_c0_g1_i4:211-651(-)
MLSWWEERLSALEVHKADGDLSFEMDPPVILSGEAWASSSSSSKRCDVNISCQLSFSVDMMETTQSGYRMQTSSSGIMTARLQLSPDERIEVVPEKVEGAEVVERVARESMWPMVQEKLTDVLKDFLKEVEAKAHGREATNCELLD